MSWGGNGIPAKTGDKEKGNDGPQNVEVVKEVENLMGSEKAEFSFFKALRCMTAGEMIWGLL